MIKRLIHFRFWNTICSLLLRTLENQSSRVILAILNMPYGYADAWSVLRTRFITLCVLYTFVALKHAASAAPRLDTRPHIPCGIIALHPTIDRFSVSPFASHHSTLLERRQAGETGAGEQERKGPSRCGAETKPTWPRVAHKNKEW